MYQLSFNCPWSHIVYKTRTLGIANFSLKPNIELYPWVPTDSEGLSLLKWSRWEVLAQKVHPLLQQLQAALTANHWLTWHPCMVLTRGPQLLIHINSQKAVFWRHLLDCYKTNWKVIHVEPNTSYNIYKSLVFQCDYC